MSVFGTSSPHQSAQPATSKMSEINGRVRGYRKAEAVVGRVEAESAPAHAQGPAAEAEVGFSGHYTGGNVGASLGEARAGPFAARAGVKFGAGVRNGVPEVDLGPVTVPCSIM